jgi:hypothetical protein
MNDLYNETVTRRGATYRYDPDRDCYYRDQELSKWDQWGWIWVIAVLAIVAYAVTP